MLKGAEVSLRALAHPLRLRILSLVTNEALSASEIARRLGQSPANVSFHVGRLREAGLVEQVGTRRVHGGEAKLYRHDPDTGDALGGGEGFAALATGMGQELARRSHHLAPDERPAFTDFEGRVTPEAAARVDALAREIGRAVHEGAVADDAVGVRLAVTVAAFPVADPP